MSLKQIKEKIDLLLSGVKIEGTTHKLIKAGLLHQWGRDVMVDESAVRVIYLAVKNFKGGFRGSAQVGYNVNYSIPLLIKEIGSVLMTFVRKLPLKVITHYNFVEAE